MENNTKNKNKDVESTVTFRKGFSYNFTDQAHDIRLHCSAFSGKEYLYVDEKRVSEKWSFRRKSIHKFAIGDDLYEVELHVVNLLTGETHCTLIKNDVHVKTLKQALKKSRQLTKDTIWWYMPACFLVGAIAGFISVKIFLMLFGE
jgi:uncharacterized membrane protein YraQ (UPF0718 family)